MHPVASAPTRPAGEARVIRSFRRRGTRLNDRQQRSWDTYSQRYLLSHAADGSLPARAFDRRAPLAVEIGYGVGEALVALATRRPEWNILGLEVWQPGVADCMAALAREDVSNVRLSTWDAAWYLEHLVEPATIAELWTFFPDPWPKPRHHKRRLVDQRFAEVVASRLVPGGIWRLATDWANYAEQMRQTLDAEPLLVGGPSERYDERPLTRFERRGIAAGRDITDLAYCRRGG